MGLLSHLALPVVMPPLLEGGSLGLVPSGTGLAGPLCHTPAGGDPFQLGCGPGVRMPPSLEGGITGTLTEPGALTCFLQGWRCVQPLWAARGLGLRLGPGCLRRCRRVARPLVESGGPFGAHTSSKKKKIVRFH